MRWRIMGRVAQNWVNVAAKRYVNDPFTFVAVPEASALWAPVAKATGAPADTRAVLVQNGGARRARVRVCLCGSDAARRDLGCEMFGNGCGERIRVCARTA